LLGAFFVRTKGKSKNERVIFLSGFSYKEQYAVIVICKDEKEQESIYNRLKEEGFKLKVVAV
jgi:predicted 3-demethylubiquinone-9 3-methyltransferase (glyoxalase superfamily)